MNVSDIYEFSIFERQINVSLKNHLIFLWKIHLWEKCYTKNMFIKQEKIGDTPWKWKHWPEMGQQKMLMLASKPQQKCKLTFWSGSYLDLKIYQTREVFISFYKENSIKDTRKKVPSNKTLAPMKYEYGHFGGWYIKSTLL